MTLQEKFGQMTQNDRQVTSPSAIRDLSIGSILRTDNGGRFEKATTSDWIGFQQAALRSRLGIPLLYGTDAVHGNSNVYGATVFPHNVGLGAARRNISSHLVGKNSHSISCGWKTEVCKDPRLEDVRSDTVKILKLLERKNVVACAKHFVGDGGTIEGSLHYHGALAVSGLGSFLAWSHRQITIGTTIFEALKAAVGYESNAHQLTPLKLKNSLCHRSCRWGTVCWNYGRKF